jgi:DNA-directed RNA polymerase specialized sigma24 family protein
MILPATLNRHVQRVARHRNQRLEPGEEGERLAQETGIAIQVGFRGLDARENGRRFLLRSVLHHVLSNWLE